MPDFDYLFSSDGPLAGVIDNYHPRPQQVDMADRVATALADSEVLVLEAGTGTGKTLGYLLPALTSGQRIIISTGTRALQDQLCSKDLPAVADAIGRPVDIALLKGRQNYLCRHRLRIACELPPTQAQGRKADINLVANWAPLAGTGDIAELEGVPESSPVWAQVTSTIDNCLGSSCPDYSNCFVVEARRRAQAADVVVVNHHLLLADLALKEEGFGEVLPGADAIIVDEAHLLADIATQFFGLNLGSRRLLNFTRDATAECVNAGLTRDHIEPELSRLDQAVRQAQLVAHEIAGNGSAVALSEPIVEALGAVWQATLALNERVTAIAEASAGLGRCLDRGESIVAQLGVLLDDTDEGGVRWLEQGERYFSARFAPYDVADKLGRLIYSRRWAWVFTSATLAIGNDFGHFCARNGLAEPQTGLLESPFDFTHKSLLYLPENMPEPKCEGYTSAVVEAAMPLINETGGGVFLLFTSHRALNLAARYLAERYSELPFPVLVQGQAPRDKLLQRFRTLGDAVLLGTGTFWQGVDVRGSALTVVVIDKLPFASPDDPLLQARLEHLRREGRNPFMEHQLPQAVIALKQGVGRLIRDFDDWGVAMVCDPRVVSRAYGRVFLDSLPAMPVTRSLGDVTAFIRAQYAESGEEAAGR